jgi:hypothetical protein
MEKLNSFNFLNSPLMSSEEINFILLEPSLDDMHSSQAKKNVKTEMLKILQNDKTGILLLPFSKTNF